MKKACLLLAMAAGILLAACGKDKNEPSNGNDYPNSPRSAVPDGLAPATWVYGGFSPLSYYDNAGHELGSDWEAARQYEVTADGYVRFGQYLGTRTGNCVTENYAWLKGTIRFEGNKFTFYPVEGRYKTIKRGCSTGNGTKERVAAGDDLAPHVYLWKKVVVENETYLRVYDKDDTNMQDLIFSYVVVK